MNMQMSIFDIIERLEASITAPNVEVVVREIDSQIPEDEIPIIRQNLLIKTVRSAFGLGRGSGAKSLQDESWIWINANDERSPFSFRNCCISLGVDPDDMKEWLGWYRKKL